MTSYQSKFLQDLCQNDEDLMTNLVALSIESVKKAMDGIREGDRTNDQLIIRQSIHLAKPNLVNLDLAHYVVKLENTTNPISLVPEIEIELKKRQP